MTFATDLFKKVAYKKETTWNVAAGASGAQYLRRVESDIDLKKDVHESKEVTTHLMMPDLRHGPRRVEGTIKGELSPKTWQDFISSALRKAYAATTAITGASITVAGAGPTYTLTRATGSFLSDGVKKGDVVMLTAGSFNAANLNKNLGVVDETATVLTVVPLNGVALVAEGPIASATVSIPGKRCFVPTTGHTDDSYSIEHWHGDNNQSRLFTGCKVDGLTISVPASGIATVEAKFLGGGETPAQTQYFTTPSAANSFAIAAAVNGVLRWGTSSINYITGAQFQYSGGMAAKYAVGSNVAAGIFPFMPMIKGSFTALFQDRTQLDIFLNETTFDFTVWNTVGGAANADFVGLNIPFAKITDANAGSGQGPIEVTCQFEAIYNSAGGAGVNSEQTIIVVQDSQAT